MGALTAISVFVWLPLICFHMMGCGNNGLPPANTVTVTVTPQTASVVAGGTVTLQGGGSGFAQPPEVAPPTVLWGIQESSNLVPMSECGELPTQNPDFTQCPYGYVVYPDVGIFPSTAVYHAPPTPGVYHVVFTATQMVPFYGLQKSATATITVTAGP